MKLTHFALAAVMVLLLLAGYLTIKSDFEGQMAAQRDEARLMNERLIERLEQLSGRTDVPAPQPPAEGQAPVAGTQTPPVASTPADLPPAGGDDDIRSREADLLRSANSVREGEATAGALSPVQQAIASLPPIARVKAYSRELEAVVLDRGERVNLRTGDEFALRRKTYVIARVRVGETVDAEECVADIIPGTMQPGLEPQPGDEAIQYE